MELVLTATDNGVDRHSATTTLNIKIADVNDNSPMFEKQVNPLASLPYAKTQYGLYFLSVDHNNDGQNE